MKRIFLLFGAVLILCSSCQRSQFATTTRIHKKGKVTYAKHYYHVSRISSKGISDKNKIKYVNMPSARFTDSERTWMHEITRISPVDEIRPETFIASVSMEPAVTAVTKQHDQSFTPYSISCKGNLKPDTVVADHQKQPGSDEDQLQDNRKVEKLGLAGFILSIPGLVPIVCLPLAILGLIFGIISLRRIKRNPALYKGKGFAIASIILGLVGILGILWFIG